MNNISDWNNRAKVYHKKIVDTRMNFVKNIMIIFMMIIATGFLALYGVRSYYYEFYRDVIDISHVCKPVTNVSNECADINVDCNCLEPLELENILDDVCPNIININIEE